MINPTPEPDALETVARLAAEAALASLPDHRPEMEALAEALAGTASAAALERLAAKVAALETAPADPAPAPASAAALERLAAKVAALETAPATAPDWTEAITALEHAVADLKLSNLERMAG